MSTFLVNLSLNLNYMPCLLFFLLGTVFLHNFRAELIMGPKFFVFIFFLCLCGLMVSYPPRPRASPPVGLHDIKKSPKYQRSIENLQNPPPQGAHGKKFRENDVNIAEK